MVINNKSIHLNWRAIFVRNDFRTNFDSSGVEYIPKEI